jgi:hypothetical protein
VFNICVWIIKLQQKYIGILVNNSQLATTHRLLKNSDLCNSECSFELGCKKRDRPQRC